LQAALEEFALIAAVKITLDYLLQYPLHAANVKSYDERCTCDTFQESANTDKIEKRSS